MESNRFAHNHLDMQGRSHIDHRRKPVVAVLDDDDWFRKIVVMLLQDEGFDVTSSWNKKEFLKSLPEINPDVIISDVQSPVMDGVTFLRLLQSDPRSSLIPVIIITGHPSPESLDLYPSGAYLVMMKPIDIDSLSNAVEGAIRYFSIT